MHPNNWKEDIWRTKMGRSRKHASKLSKEVFDIAPISKSVTTNEEKQVEPIPLFDETSYEIWESSMEA